MDGLLQSQPLRHPSPLGTTPPSGGLSSRQLVPPCKDISTEHTANDVSKVGDVVDIREGTRDKHIPFSRHRQPVKKERETSPQQRCNYHNKCTEHWRTNPGASDHSLSSQGARDMTLVLLVRVLLSQQAPGTALCTARTLSQQLPFCQYLPILRLKLPRHQHNSPWMCLTVIHFPAVTSSYQVQCQQDRNEPLQLVIPTHESNQILSYPDSSLPKPFPTGLAHTTRGSA